MNRNRIPCVIKATGSKTFCLAEQIELAMKDYTASRSLSTDKIRHGKARTQDQTSLQPVLENSSEAYQPTGVVGDTRDGRQAIGSGSLNIHRAFTARLEIVKKNIGLGPRPVSSFNSKKASKALKLFASRIQPLTQLLESLFEVFLPLEFEKYQKVFEHTFPEPQDPIHSAFGLWNSRGLVINTVTNVHRDLHDVCRGWCAITPFGHFQDGYAFFPQLGVKFECNVGKC